MAVNPCKSAYLKAIKAVLALDAGNQRKVLAQLKKRLNTDSLDIEEFIEDLRDKRFRKGFACPHCNSEKGVRNGTQRGRQSFKCRSCNKYFSDHTHTPFRGTHYPEKWLTFMEHMISGYSIRKSVKTLEVAISTISTWRHKLLTALKRMEVAESESLL